MAAGIAAGKGQRNNFHEANQLRGFGSFWVGVVTGMTRIFEPRLIGQVAAGGGHVCGHMEWNESA
jgi:hypothetical protein